jgi:uncharacterized membrane protein
MDFVYQLLVLLPLMLTIVLLACAVKFAGRLFKRVSISWKHAVLYAVALILVNAVIRYTISATGISHSLLLTALVALLVQLALGGWFFAKRATTAEGEPIGPRGGAKISAIVFGMSAAAAGLFWLVAPV